jgi:hypothetical protein
VIDMKTNIRVNNKKVRRRIRRRNCGSGNGAEIATLVVEKGKPLITLVK